MSTVTSPQGESGKRSMSAVQAEAAGRSVRPGGTWQSLIYRYGVVIVWICLIAVFAVTESHTFFTTRNLQSILSSQSSSLVLALALIPTLTASEYDVSVAGTAGLAGTLVGTLNGVDHHNLAMAVIVALVVGSVIGAVNGFVVVHIGVNSFVVTLGMGTLLEGVAIWVSNDSTVGGVNGWLGTAVNHPLGGISLSFFYAVALVIVLWYLSRHTPLGRYTLFIGQSREVARLLGIRVDRIRFGAFVLGGLVAALAGVMLVGVGGGIDPTSTSTLLLPAFAAAFLGAACIEPGRFNAIGVLVAVYFLATGITGIQLGGVTGWVVDVFYGGILVAAVTLSTAFDRKTS